MGKRCTNEMVHVIVATLLIFDFIKLQATQFLL